MAFRWHPFSQTFDKLNPELHNPFAVKGTYCILFELPEDASVTIRSLGKHQFQAGIYAYVGSALGGVEKRIARHRSKRKRKRWHIDFLLEHADVLSTVAIPSEQKEVECEVAKALLRCEGASMPVKGFGSSDCKCGTHLVFFGETDPEWIAEAIAMNLSMLQCAYPKSMARARRKAQRRE